MGIYLSLLSVILLGLVAGLLLALWFQLKAWKTVAKDAPLLAETLTGHLLNARNGLADLKKALVGQGPELDRLISDAQKARVELQFLLQRAEQIGARMEATHTPIEVTPNAETPADAAARLREERLAQETVETVSSANGMASGQGRPETLGGDPLEELLAGLNQAAETPLEDSNMVGRRKRVSPVTQAELDLQSQVMNRATAGKKGTA